MKDHDEPFSLGEELAHSLTHGLGLALGIAAQVIMIVFAAQRGTAVHVVACTIYGTTLILLYGASTLYHGLPPGRAKRVAGILDHAAIFVLIAGTYTPFTLVTLQGGLGWTLFGITWGVALAGVLLEAISRGRFRRVQLGLYLLMGWMVVLAIKPLARGSIRAGSRCWWRAVWPTPWGSCSMYGAVSRSITRCGMSLSWPGVRAISSVFCST